MVNIYFYGEVTLKLPTKELWTLRDNLFYSKDLETMHFHQKE